MSLKNISIVLVKPQIGENIGATARVMKNFGLSALSIVNPKEQWPNRKAIYTSVKASDIIHKAKIFNSTKDALSKSDIVFATTARIRNINKKIYTLTEAIKIINTTKKKISISNDGGLMVKVEGYGSCDPSSNLAGLQNVDTRLG